MLQKHNAVYVLYKITSRSVSLRQLTELVNYYAPPLMAGALSDDPVWRLSVAYIGSKSRTERPGKTKIGTEVAHVTRDSDISFKVKRSRSPGRFAHRRVGASGGCSGGRGNVLAVGNCYYVAVCSVAQGASAPTREERGGGISWRPPAYSLLLAFSLSYRCVRIHMIYGRLH